MHIPESVSAVWSRLRATRSRPPDGVAGNAKRRQTYAFALEQAEQMFRAAAEVGPATQPLLLFYGLSQAGRAIAAAASEITDDDWQLRGHGIRSVPESLSGPLPNVLIRVERVGSRGSFARLSELLESPLWDDVVTFGTLWDCVPENRLVPLDDNATTRRTPLWVVEPDRFIQPHPLVSVPVAYFPSWVINSSERRASLSNYLAAFPEAQDYCSYYHSGTTTDAIPEFAWHPDGTGELLMNWELPGGDGGYSEQIDFLRTKTRSYGGSLHFFPAVDSSQRGIHPLMAWWAVLFVLSMLARYQPAEWMSHIDVNNSRHAVPLEDLFKQAIQVVPWLIAEAIDELT